MIKILLTTLLLSFTAISHATVITFDDWQYNSSYQIDWRVTIDDESNDGFLPLISVSGQQIRPATF